ncbi:hypothetical protein Tco_0311612 [Tanacetum coccineum]
MEVTQLDMTNLKWSVSTATRWDTLQGNAEDIGTKITGTGIKTTLKGLYMVDDEVPINMVLMDFLDSEFNKSEFNLATYKRGLASVEEQLVFYKKNEVIFCKQLAVLKRDISYKDSKLSMLKSELEKLKQEKESNQLKIENFDNASKRLFLPPKFDLSKSGLEEFQQPEFEGYRPKTSKNVSEDISNEVRESPDAPLVKELVLTAITIKGKWWPNSEVVNTVRENQVNVVKASACWVWRPTKLNSASITLKKHNYVDARGRSKSGICPISHTLRNLIKDMLPLGEEPNEGKLLMCDKKNNVLFTDTGCFVLSPNFKLDDESQVLLKVPRKNNMYIVDMKNIVPKESLTCLVAKVTLDESMLWH